MNQLEKTFKNKLRADLHNRFPGCVVIINDPNDRQGICDMLILYRSTWAMLEGKRSKSSPYRPNQPYYVRLFNDMSFAAFIYPENKAEVLDSLEDWFLLQTT